MDITDKIDNALEESEGIILDEVIDPDTVSTIKNISHMVGSSINKENIKMVVWALAQVYDADKKMVMQTIKNFTKMGKKK